MDYIARLKQNTYPGCVANEQARYSSFGGNQHWFSDKDGFWDKTLHDYGCGVIAMADVIRYIEENAAFPNAPAMTIEDYKKKVRKLHWIYAHVIPGNGIPGWALAVSFVIYGMIHGDTNYDVAWGIRRGRDKGLIKEDDKGHVNGLEKLHLRRHRRITGGIWYTTMIDKYLMDRIRRQIEKDVPVVLAIGPDFRIFHRKKGVNFYHVSPAHNEPGKTVMLDHVRLVHKNVKRHFVTVTGICRVNGEVYLQIASWGQRYYIKWSEYKLYRKQIAGAVNSSILCVTTTR